MNPKKLVATLIFIFLLSQGVFSQEIVYKQHFELEHGLNDRIVHSITRDSKGYFYLLNERGLQRWDGQKFSQNVPISNNLTNSVVSLQPFADHIILTTKQDSFLRYYEPQNNNIINKKLDNISYIQADESYIYLISDKYIKIYNDIKLSQILDSIPIDSQVSQIINYNNYWVINQNNKIVFISKSEKNTHIIHETGTLILNSENRLILIQNDHLKYYENDSFKFWISLPVEDEKLAFVKKDLSGNIILSYLIKPDYINKIFVVNNDGNLENYQSVLSINNRIRDFYADNLHHKLLVATYNGMYYLTLKPKFLNTYSVLKNTSSSDFGKVVTSTCLDDQENVYYAIETLDINKIENGHTINLNENYRNSKRFIGNRKISYYKPTNSLIVHTYKRPENQCIRSLFRFDLDNKSVHPFSEVDMCLNDFIWYDQNILLLAGNDTKGGLALALFDLQNEKFRAIPITSNSYATARTIYKDASNNLWISTANGVIKSSHDFKHFEKIIPNNQKEYPQFDQLFNVMSYQYGEIMVFGTLDGLYFYDDKTNQITKRLNEQNLLSSGVIYSCIEDDDHNLWIGTGNGLSVINKELQLVDKLSIKDGMPASEFNTVATCKSSDGKLYFGTLNGLIEINQDEWRQEKQPAFINLLSVKLFSKGNLKATLPILEKIIDLPHNIDSIAVVFDNPQFFLNQNINEINTNINAIANVPLNIEQKSNAIVISNLSSKEFNLDVYMNDGKLIDTISFRRHASQSLLWTLIIGTFVGLLVFFISTIINSRIQSGEKEKKELQNQINELRLSALQSQMNPHFIFNALGSIAYFIQTNEQSKADKYLNDFASLMRSILESSKAKLINISDEINMLKLYTGLEHVRFEDKFDIVFEIDENLDTDFQIPPMIIQPYIENAINHGLFHLMDKKGLLKVSFIQKDDDTLVCKIEDNGIGREASKNFKKEKHKSRGMQIVEDRIFMTKQSHNLNIDIQVKDLIKENKASGTKVIIKFSY
ncbi:MAG: histidine kinase [Saprospiraceae bacterium]